MSVAETAKRAEAASSVAAAVAAVSAAFFESPDCTRCNECPASTRRTCAPRRPPGSSAEQTDVVAGAGDT